MNILSVLDSILICRKQIRTLFKHNAARSAIFTQKNGMGGVKLLGHKTEAHKTRRIQTGPGESCRTQLDTLSCPRFYIHTENHIIENLNELK